MKFTFTSAIFLTCKTKINKRVKRESFEHIKFRSSFLMCMQNTFLISTWAHHFFIAHERPSESNNPFFLLLFYFTLYIFTKRTWTKITRIRNHARVSLYDFIKKKKKKIFIFNPFSHYHPACLPPSHATRLDLFFLCCLATGHSFVFCLTIAFYFFWL